VKSQEKLKPCQLSSFYNVAHSGNKITGTREKLVINLTVKICILYYFTSTQYVVITWILLIKIVALLDINIFLW